MQPIPQPFRMLLLVCTLAMCPGATILADTLAYWRFEDVPVGKDTVATAVDLSASPCMLNQAVELKRPDGVAQAPCPFIDGQLSIENRQCISFEPGHKSNQADCLLTDSSSALNFQEKQPFTTEGWFYPRSYGRDKAVRHVLFKRDKTFAGYAIYLDAQGLLECRIAASQHKQAAVRSTSPIPLNAWTHFAVTRDSEGVIRLYLNGKHIHTGSTKLPLSLVNEGQLHVGNHGMVANPDFAFDGMIDELRISDEALTPETFLNANQKQATRDIPVRRVDITELGAIADDGKDDTHAFIQATRLFADAANLHLVLTPGRLDIDASKLPGDLHLISLRDRNAVTIEGQGAQLVFKGECKPIFLSQCHNIQISNLTIDWIRPPFSQGKIININDHLMDIRIDDAYPIDEKIEVAGIMDYDPQTANPVGFIDAFDSAINEPQRIAPQTLRITWEKPRQLTRPIGTPVVIRHTVYGYNAIEMHGCQNISLESITVHTAPGMALMAGMCDNIHLNRFDILPTPRTNRLMSTTADGTMFSSCSGDILIENSRYQAMGDDGVNVWTKYMVIKQIHRSDAMFISARKGWRGPLPVAGESIELVAADTLLTYGTMTVKDASYNPNQQAYEVQFTQPLPNQVKEGDLACDISRLATLHVKNSSFIGNRARAILISTHQATIENCQFTGQTLSGINIYCDPVRNSQQGSSARDVVIRNNQFTGTGAAAIFIHAQATKPVPGVHQQIQITNNTFTRDSHLDDARFMPEKDTLQYWLNAIYVGNSQQVLIRDNQFNQYKQIMHVRASEHVQFHGNVSDIPATVDWRDSTDPVIFGTNRNMTPIQNQQSNLSSAYRIFDQR